LSPFWKLAHFDSFLERRNNTIFLISVLRRSNVIFLTSFWKLTQLGSFLELSNYGSFSAL
jgi:hypothetical protein